MSEENNHERLAYRLAKILDYLNSGKRVYVDQLAKEFKVHPRTIQRDLNSRLGFLRCERHPDNSFSIDPLILGNISYRDIDHFASLAGLKGLFPKMLETRFLRELLDARLQNPIAIHAPSREEIDRKAHEYQVLKEAISKRQMVRFNYEKPNEAKKRVEVAPYRLVNHDAVWYLAATDEGRPKSYSLARISDIEVREETFEPDQSVLKMLDDEDSIWLNRNKTEVVLTVSPAVSGYFRRRKLVSQQTIVKELEDGGLIVSGKFAHPNQIFPVIRYWMPHVRIVSPESWQEDLEREIESYLGR